MQEQAISERIRRAMIQSGLTQIEISRRSGISYRQVHNIMRHGGKLRADTLSKVCSAIGVTVESLMKDEAAPGEYPLARSTPMLMRETKREENQSSGLAPPWTVARCIQCLAEQFDVSEEKLRSLIMDFVMRSGKRKEEKQS